MRFNDAVIGAVFVIFALAEIAFSSTFPSLHGQAYGPSLFPILIGCGLLACGIMLIVKGLRARKLAPGTEDANWMTLGDWARDPVRRTNMLLIPSLLIVYILFADVIGFLILGTAILALLLYRLGSTLLVSFVYAVIATVLLQQLFSRVLLVPLPAGLTSGLFG